MRKEPTIQIFELDNASLKKVESEHPLIEEISQTEYRFTEDATHVNYLEGNPFLYDPVITNKLVSSLEDFLIEVDDEKIAFGDVLRNPKFKPRKRYKIVRKTFKAWKKDYQIKKKQAFSENEKVVQIIGELSYLNYSWKLKLAIYLIFILMLFLVVTDSTLWLFLKGKSFGYLVYKSLNTMYQNKSYLKIVGNFGIYITLILIIYSSIYSFVIRNFQKNYKIAKSFLNNSERTINKEFKRKYTKAKRYYLKRINSKKYPFFPPLRIEEVQEGKMSIKIFNDICKVTIDRAYRIKKTKPILKFLNILLQSLGFACFIVILAMSIYNIFLNIF